MALRRRMPTSAWGLRYTSFYRIPSQTTAKHVQTGRKQDRFLAPKDLDGVRHGWHEASELEGRSPLGLGTAVTLADGVGTDQKALRREVGSCVSQHTCPF